MNVHKEFADFFEEDIIKPYAYLVSKKLNLNFFDIDNLIPNHSS